QYRLRGVGGVPGRPALGDGTLGPDRRWGDHPEDRREVVPGPSGEAREGAPGPGPVIAGAGPSPSVTEAPRGPACLQAKGGLSQLHERAPPGQQGGRARRTPGEVNASTGVRT